MALFHSAAHKLPKQPELMKVNTYMMFHQHIVNLTCCFFVCLFLFCIFRCPHETYYPPSWLYIYPLNEFEDLNILSGKVQKEKFKKYSPSESLMVWSTLFKKKKEYVFFQSFHFGMWCTLFAALQWRHETASGIWGTKINRYEK